MQRRTWFKRITSWLLATQALPQLPTEPVVAEALNEASPLLLPVVGEGLKETAIIEFFMYETLGYVIGYTAELADVDFTYSPPAVVSACGTIDCPCDAITLDFEIPDNSLKACDALPLSE